MTESHAPSLFLAEGEFFRRPTQANSGLEWGTLAWENRPSGAEAHFSQVFTARLKPCPFKTPVSSELSKNSEGPRTLETLCKGPDKEVRSARSNNEAEIEKAPSVRRSFFLFLL
jgi:hypothetical protein